MRIREADEGDAAAVAGLWTEAYATAGPEGRQEPYALQEYFAVAAAAEVQVAADEGGTVIGVIALFAPGASGRSVGGAGEAGLVQPPSAPSGSRSGAVPTRPPPTRSTNRSAGGGCRTATAPTARA